jgi:acyl-CoA thioesterase
MGRMWAVKPIKGGFGAEGERQIWVKEVRELVGGVALTPFQRVAVAADFASPFAHASSDQGLGYINTDVTVYLHRLPDSEWIGFRSVNHQATDGVAVGECWLYDAAGSIGFASCSALAQKKPPR